MKHHVVPRSTYYWVSLWLALLMAATVAAAQVDLGPWNLGIAMAIALAKGVLIVLYFMHVLYSPPLVQLFAASGFIFLVLLFVFTFADIVTRG